MPLMILSMLWGGLSKVIGGLFTFFTTKPGVYIGIVLLVIGSGWYLNHHGYAGGLAEGQRQEQERIADATAKALVAGIKVQKDLDRNIIAATDAAAFLRGKAQAQTITITKEIPKYVTVQTDATFPLPCGLLRTHDAAALGVDPETLGNPAGLADGVACPVKASDFAAIIVSNYGIDHEKDAQIIGLQDLARTLKATIEGADAP